MVTFMSTAVNPDALLITLWTLDLWLGARRDQPSGRGADVIAVGVVTAVAILTKATSYALVVPVAARGAPGLAATSGGRAPEPG